MKMYLSYRHQNGLSLVELMVASVVGLMLMMGMTQIFMGNKESYRVQEALSRLQENGRFALMFMEQDIRMADYRGCGTRAEKIPLINTLVSNTDYLWDFATAIEGYEATSSSGWDRALDASITSPLGGSDILTVRRATGETFKVTTQASGTEDVELNSGVPFKNEDIVMVADCEVAAVFQVTSTDAEATAGTLEHDTGVGSPGNSTDDLGRSFVDGDVFLFDTVSYYVRNGTSGRPALYRRVGNVLNELIEGVEQMQVVYGEDTNADALVDRYVAANGVADWDNVISVSINLLMTTLDDHLTPTGEPQAYSFNGVTYDGGDNALPGDERLRRAFSSTVTLRNRTL